MNMVPKSISAKVLTVGADFENHRGGIGAVIELYTTFFENFKFIPTYRPYGSNITKSLFFVKQFFKLVKTLTADKAIRIVHIHGSHKGSFYRKLALFYIAKKIFAKTVIYHLHSSSFDLFYQRSGKFSKKLISYVINNADTIVCLSPWWQNFYSTNFNCKSIVIINNVVNKPARVSVLHSQDISLPVRFLFLGRIGDRKGIFDLLDVIKANKNNFDGQFKLAVGGDGEIDRLKAFVTENHLGDLVEYIGWVTKTDKVQHLTNAHAYILPSYNEGLPISILEAMSYGLPILSTDIGGIPEVLENNVNGLMFKPGDKTAIAKSINYLLNNHPEVVRLGNGSLSKIEPYLPATVSAQLCALYERLLNQ